MIEKLVNKVICADSLKLMAGLPDNSIDVIITDPVWPGCRPDLPGRDNAVEIFKIACKQFARLTSRLVLHLGMMTDPRILRFVPKRLPFVQVCWLRIIPCSYRGPIMVGADVAYVFGHKRLPGDGTKVFGGECNGVNLKRSTSGKHVLKDNPHPTSRHIHHVSWLVRRFSKPNDLILDPFCGAGTTLLAAKLAGRRYIGIDIKQEFCDYAEHRLEYPDIFTVQDELKRMVPKRGPLKKNQYGKRKKEKLCR